MGDVGSVSMCRRIFKEQTSESGDIPFYKIGTFGGEADAFISRELFEEYKAKYPYPKKGDILISASGSIGRTVEFTGENEYFQDSNIVWLNHDERLDNSFLKCFYSVVKWAGIEGSTIKRLYNDKILNTTITLPSVAEQKKIGEYFSIIDHLITLHQQKITRLIKLKKAMLEKMFPKKGSVIPEIRFNGFANAWEQRKLGEVVERFDNLRIPVTSSKRERGIDHLITLHQRKYEKLQNMKKACLEKMFPQNGSNVPEIRFKGFTEAWEQRKLGELVDRVVRKNTNNESTLPLTISAQYGLVDQVTYFNNRVASRDVSNYYLVLNSEFAYNKSTSDGYPFGAVKRLDLYEKGVLSTLYIVFAPKKDQQIDSDFLTVFFDTDRWHKGVAERAAEGARNHGLLNISAENFFDLDLSVPKDIAEQIQIGAFIRKLDHLITLHQRELEKLQNIKKSMLEKMFVSEKKEK